MTIPWLTILALLPAAGAVLLIFAGVKAAKHVALLISLFTLVFALIIAAQFKIGGGMQMVEQVPWIKPLGAYYALGLDGLGLTLVLLVVIITPVVIIASWRDFDPAGPESFDKLRTASEGPSAPLVQQPWLRSMTPGCSLPWCSRSRAVRCTSSWPPTCSCSTCSSRSS